jgi:hypothetical protein
MSDVPYTSLAAAKLGREWARRFQALPPSAGVIFISVLPRPAPRGAVRVFYVTIGVGRNLSEGLGTALVKHVLGKELESGKYEIHIEALCGLHCAGRDEAPDSDQDRQDVSG